MRKLIHLKDHPANNDPLVTLILTRRVGDVYHSIYRATEGFVITLGFPECLDGFFGSMEEARSAMGEL